MDQAAHDRLSTKINQLLKYLESLIRICNEDFPSQNYEIRQKYEDQLRQLQNENLELQQEIINFDERSNIFETLVQDINKNLDIIEEQQMNDEKRKELQKQTLKLQKNCEDHIKKLSKVRKMIIFLSKIDTKILEMFKVYIQNTQTSTDLKKRRLNIDKLKQSIENLERIIPELQEIDESLLKEISKLQNYFEVSVKKIQMYARDETEEAFTESSEDSGNESDQFFEVSNTST